MKILQKTLSNKLKKTTGDEENQIRMAELFL